MDWRLIIPIIGLFILFIMMGSNPFEAPPGWKPPTFTNRLEEKLQSENKFGFSGTNSNTLIAPPVNGDPMQPRATLGVPYPGSNTAPGSSLNTNPFAAGSPAIAPAPKPAGPPPNQPEPFRNLPAGGGTPRSDLNEEFLRGSYMLSDGTTLEYSGADVFTVDASGNKTYLKDGKYSLANGETLLVRDGKKQLPPRFYADMYKRS